MNELILGLAAGTGLGFLLQRGRVLRFEKQIGALLLRDMTILKFMLSAIIVGMLGLAIAHDVGLISFNHKTMNLGAILTGGALFGIGWAVCGYCPGTAVGALGEGRWHAAFVILGMLVGALLYVEAQPWLERTLLTWHDYGKISLPRAINSPDAPVIAGFTGIALLLFWLFERKGL